MNYPSMAGMMTGGLVNREPMLQLLLPRNWKLGQWLVTSLGSASAYMALGLQTPSLCISPPPPPPPPPPPRAISISTSLAHTLRESSISNGHCSREEVEVESRESVLQGGDGYEAVGHTGPDEGCRLPSMVAFHQATCFHGQSVYTLRKNEFTNV